MGSLNLTIQGAMTTAMITAGLFCSAQARARQQQQQPSDVPKIIRKSGGVLQGSATRRVEPTYPPLAKAAHVSGAVVVELTIDESGDVASARAISGHPLLKDAAVEAALGWKFHPTTLQGIPVKVIGTVTFNFQLGTSEDVDPIDAAKKSVEEHPDSAQAHYDLATAYYNWGRRLEAIRAARDAVRIDPKFEIAYRALGEYLGGVGTQDEPSAEAINALKEALHLDPQDSKAQTSLGLVYIKLERFEDAAELFRKQISDNPTVAEPYLGLAVIYGRMEKYEQAVEAVKKALEIKSDPPLSEYARIEWHIALGTLYEKLGRPTEAISAIKQAIALDPRDAQAHFALAMAYVKSGDKKSAMEEYEVLKGHDPRMAEDLLKAIKE